jgi:hypothetical protein
MHNTAWAAGLFEGEGCMYKTPQGYHYIQLKMTDLDVVERFREWLGHGNIIRDTGGDKYGHKKVYQLKVGKGDVVRNALSKMLPYFGNRRAHKALDFLDDIELQP